MPVVSLGLSWGLRNDNCCLVAFDLLNIYTQLITSQDWGVKHALSPYIIGCAVGQLTSLSLRNV